MQQLLDLRAQRVNALEVTQDTEGQELLHREHRRGFRARADGPKRGERGLDQLGQDRVVSQFLHQFREAIPDHGRRSKPLLFNAKIAPQLKEKVNYRWSGENVANAPFDL
jgi:hypothetical protein